MELIICKNEEEVTRQTANVIIKDIILDPKITLGLATGSSPIGVYEKLINAYQSGLISFKDVETFNLDEYIGIERSHPQSYYSFMNQHLFNHIDINRDNIHLPRNHGGELEDLANEYSKMIDESEIELQLLGIGSNGHIGFNEPGTPFRNETFIVELDDQTRNDNARFFSSLEEVPKFAITMGIKNIMRAKKIVVLAFGENKSDAVYKMINGNITNLLPASILQLHPNCTVIIDEAAASKLNK